MAYTLRPGGRKDSARDLRLWVAAALGDVLRGPSTLWIQGRGAQPRGWRGEGQWVRNWVVWGVFWSGAWEIWDSINTASCELSGWSLGLSGPFSLLVNGTSSARL